MSKVVHEITTYRQRYAKQYGYSYSSRMTCSCGFSTSWGASDIGPDVEGHKQQAILDALGLEFNVVDAGVENIRD